MEREVLLDVKDLDVTFGERLKMVLLLQCELKTLDFHFLLALNIFM